MTVELTAEQQNVADAIHTTTFLEGAAGTGKSTAGLARLTRLLEAGVPASSILVMIPQRTLGLPYYDLLADSQLAAGEQVNILTLGGLARRAVDLFWLLVAEDHGFKQSERRPTFLSLETAQYYMARIVGPVIEREGYFDTVTIDRNRLYSQIIDNLNKAAVVGFGYNEIAERLKAAWVGDAAQLKMYDDVQECARLFRAYCVEHNLLDFSLQVELFRDRLIQLPQVQQHILGAFKHIIADNVEEDTPVSHDVLHRLILDAASALVIYDSEAGYRRFLGADPVSAYVLRDFCHEHITFAESFTATPELTAFGEELAYSLSVTDTAPKPDVDPRGALQFDGEYRYHPEMIDGVAADITRLVHEEGVPPQEIVVMAPYLSDALRFSLMNRLEAANVPVRSHRPSRSLREEPAAQCLLTLAQLAHPQWRLRPTQFDIVYALIEAIGEMDLVRAQLLARSVYSIVDHVPRLAAFDTVKPSTQERITFTLGERYERLRLWLDDYALVEEPFELDHFFSYLFGEVLSQPGFGFHDDFDSAEVAANLIDSAQKFRLIIAESDTPSPDKSLAQEYVEMVAQGVIADQYLRGWDVGDDEAVLLAPAYTFLMSNRPVDYQYWLNVGGRGWAERLYQPLTNPYVLSLQWNPDKKWTDEDEQKIAKDSLYRLALGLARRCRKGITLGFSELGEQGYEQRGMLLHSIQSMLRRLSA